MKVNILGIQPGTVTEGMTNKEYFDKQIDLMCEQIEHSNEKYDLVMFVKCL